MANLSNLMKRWDEQFNDLPRKIQLILMVLLSAFVLVKTLPYIWPFVLGFLLAALMKPIVDFLTPGLKKLKSGRAAATLMTMVLVYGVIFLVMSIFAQQIMFEGQRLFKNVPSLLEWVQKTIEGWVERFVPDTLSAQQEALTATIGQMLNSITEGLHTLLGKVTPAVASGAWTTVTRIPHTILFVVMTVMSSYYFTADGDRIKAFVVRQLPHIVAHRANDLRAHIGHAVLQQVKAQIIVSCAISVSLVIGFAIFGIEYALLLGFVIGVLDVLPIIGAGTVLIPWSLFNLFAGNFPMGIKLVVMYLLVVVIRQIIEPRIVGKKLGLYPLVSMLCIYVGLKVMGFAGLIFAPIIAHICKCVLETDAEVRREQRAQASLSK